MYDSFSDVGERQVWWRADFQSGSRVLKKVFWTFSYLYLWHTMWFHAIKLLKTLKFWKSLNSLCKSGSRPQKSPKKAQKTDHSIAIYSNFLIGMVYFGYHLVKPHVQTVQNMYGKGGWSRESLRPCYGQPKLTLIDLPHRWFEPLYPKVFGGTPKVELMSTVRPPCPLKVRWCRFLAAQKGRF